MHFDIGTIYELLKATPYEDISSLCSTNKQFRDVCQSNLGVKIILSKLEQLPPDLLFDKLLTLKYPVIMNFCQISNKINTVCQNNDFWNQKFKRDFPDFRNFHDFSANFNNMAQFYKKEYYDSIYADNLIQAIRNNDYKTIEEASKHAIPYRSRKKLISEAVKMDNLSILDLLMIGQSRELIKPALMAAVDTNNLKIVKHIFDDYDYKTNKINFKSLPTIVDEIPPPNPMTAAFFMEIIRKNPDLKIIDYLSDQLSTVYFQSLPNLFGMLIDAANNNIDMIKLFIKKFGHLNEIDPNVTLYEYLRDTDIPNINNDIIILFILYGANITKILSWLNDDYHDNHANEIKKIICYILDQPFIAPKYRHKFHRFCRNSR